MEEEGEVEDLQTAAHPHPFTSRHQPEAHYLSVVLAVDWVDLGHRFTPLLV